MKRKKKGYAVQVVKNADGTTKIINHNATNRMNYVEKTMHYKGKHLK